MKGYSINRPSTRLIGMLENPALPEPSRDRLEKFFRAFSEVESALVAFSGGLDSSFLLFVAREMLGDRAAAYTAVSPFVPARELKSARALASRLGVRHFLVDVDPLSNPELARNPFNRCYLCKKMVYTKGLLLAREHGFAAFMDGTTASDATQHRPGRQAVMELGVATPLMAAGMSRKDIQEASRMADLETWNKNPISCLATRLPYETLLEPKTLLRIDRAEEILASFGFAGVRVRVHADLARIEVPSQSLAQLAQDPLRSDICREFKSLGFAYITVDLEGFRSGSMDLHLSGDPTDRET
ncbi:MAG: ATP-dependent sacrificial sulfur transferase LarE [Deltaproteobacteria bacterium]|nr:ATP-dependent sacrificial sulfur transferase LarE [Deltaproteobacteria bacterium]